MKLLRKQPTPWRWGTFLLAAFCHPLFGQPFVHPGALSTQPDLDRMRAKVAANAQPWKASWDILVANSHAQLSYTPNPQVTICRGGACAGMGYPENYMIMANDAHAAYQCALRYQVSGDTNYAEKAVQIMDAWSSTLNLITGDSNALLAGGIQGYQWACAAELMRNYSGWATTNFARFQSMMLTKFYPMCSDFLARHNGTCDTHYWANWDLAAMTTILGVGVLCDRRDLYNEAIGYFQTGIGNGAASKIVFFMHPGYMGQWQEAGRDQGHCTLGPALLGPFCEIAWNQGDDLYGYATNLFLAGSEYVAEYNAQPLTATVPYVTYANCENNVQPAISSASRGIVRPGWDLVYNHYVNREGLSALFTAQIAAQVRPEGGGGNYGPNSGGYDQLGFTTLTHTLDPIATNAVPAPSGLRAEVRNNAVTLSWWGSAYASSYNVKRAAAIGGPYNTIAYGVTTNLYYVDVGLTPGTTCYYAVSAVVGGIEGANSAPASATSNAQLRGAIIGSDSSYNNLGATKETVFDGALGNYYDAANVSGDWAGLDLGVSDIITGIAYAPRISFAGRMVGGVFQGANVPDFSSGVVTLFTVPSAPPTGVLTYQAISNPNAFRYVRYLGPVNGSCNVAEVQFHGYAKPTNALAAPVNLSGIPGNAQAALTWSASPAASSFNIKRRTLIGGPYTTIASGVKTTSFLDLSLTNLTTYYYTVSAVNGGGESLNSAEVAMTPAAPLLNQAAGGTASDWTGSSPGATEGPGKAFDGTTSTKWYNSATSFPGWLQYNFGAGVNRTVVRYDVSSANDLPQRDPSAWLFQASNNGSTWTTLDTQSAQTFSSRYQAQSYWITNSTAYQYYRLYITTNYYMLTNHSVTSAYGVQLSELALLGYAPAPPSAPTALTAAPGDARVTLSWTPVSGAVSYNVKRSGTSGGPYVFSTIAAPTAPIYVDAEVINGSVYYYVVSAVNTNGESANSLEVSARPVSLSPVSLSSAEGGSQLQLSWPADHIGWRLLVQTNPPGSGLSTNWVTLPGTAATNQFLAPLAVTNGSVFFRLVYP